MSKITERFFPQPAGNDYQGNHFASWVFLGLALLGLGRSLIHILAADGGAGSIAGMNLTGFDAADVIFVFALWGSAQLLTAVLQLLVYWRYKSLIPLMYLFMLAEVLLRMFVGLIKPAAFSHTPPGAFSNYLLIPLLIAMLILTQKKC
ncbi:hypothetical protein SDC9_103870 [bioreactor metagenome]|uniref:DUF4345 domain-containing protein n=1 Tax=bioreactor metagenome TaxID=1076179 RepID=A0A645AUY1_9ZZZZ